jgi:arylsulfatase
VPAWDSLSSGEKAESSRKMELFAAMVEHMDWNIGRLVQYLKDRGLYDDTVFIFLSDNGPEGTSWKIGPPWDNSRMADWGKKGTFVQYGAAWAQVGAGPFRMFKGYESEGGIRTPMIVAGSGVVAGGRLSRAVTHVTDVPATILKIANVSSPTVFDGRPVLPLQGRDFLPILQDPKAIVRTDTDWIGGEVFGTRSIRQGDWKLLWLCQPAGPDDWQLYNLTSDPGETKDLSRSQPEIRARLVRLWEEYVRTNNVIIPTASPVCATAKP